MYQHYRLKLLTRNYFFHTENYCCFYKVDYVCSIKKALAARFTQAKTDPKAVRQFLIALGSDTRRHLVVKTGAVKGAGTSLDLRSLLCNDWQIQEHRPYASFKRSCVALPVIPR